MPIEMPEYDGLSVHIANSCCHLQNAVTVLFRIRADLALSGDRNRESECNTLIRNIEDQQAVLAGVSREFSATRAKLTAVDKGLRPHYDPENNRLTQTVTSGAGIGALSSVVGHAVSSVPVNAALTIKYRHNARQLHGFMLEVMLTDKLNYGLQHKLFTKAKFPGTNVTGQDVVVTRFGKQITQFETKAYKDVSRLKRIMRQGKYQGSVIATTSEAAAETGAYDCRISRNRLMNVTNYARTHSTAALRFKAIGRSAAAGGAVGGVIDGGIAAVSNFSAWKSKQITSKQYFSSIGKEAAIGAATGALTSAILTVAGVTLTGGTALIAGAVIGGTINGLLHTWLK